MAEPIFIDTNNGARAIHIRNFARQDHQTGMRVTNDGFFHITNKISVFGAPAGTEARLDSGGNWSRASDRRLKTDIEDVSGLLEKVLSLNPVAYHYINQDLAVTPHKSVGFIAQDVEPIFPHLVTGSDEDAKYLDYTGLVPIVVAALKELKNEYDGRIAELEAQVSELRG
jgi:hypothetical protein